MRASTTVASLRLAPAVARGHVRLYGLPVALPEPPWFLDGASGVVTTAEDMGRWLAVQASGGRTPGGRTPGAPPLLSPAGLRTLHETSLGWSAGPAPGTFAHSGWLFTFMAHQIVSPDSGYGVAVMTTRGVTLGPDDAAEIAHGILALTRGATPAVGAPVGWIVDLTLLALTVLVVLAARRRLRRTPRPPLGARIAWLVPVVAFAGLRQLVAFVFGGRDGTWLQVAYVGPALVVWLAAAAACGVVVVARGLRKAAPPASPR
jgi:CubicO group peptidase (beta-lactamase class C family)